MDEYSSSWGVLYTAPAEVPRGDEPQLPAFLTCLMTYFLSASFPPPSHFLVPPLPETISWMNYFTSHSCFREQNLRQYECRAEGETHTHKHTHTDTLFQSFTKVKIWHIILDTVSMHVITEFHERLSFLQRTWRLRHCRGYGKTSLMWWEGCCYE